MWTICMYRNRLQTVAQLHSSTPVVELKKVKQLTHTRKLSKVDRPSRVQFKFVLNMDSSQKGVKMHSPESGASICKHHFHLLFWIKQCEGKSSHGTSSKTLHWNTLNMVYFRCSAVQMCIKGKTRHYAISQKIRLIFSAPDTNSKLSGPHRAVHVEAPSVY